MITRKLNHASLRAKSIPPFDRRRVLFANGYEHRAPNRGGPPIPHRSAPKIVEQHSSNNFFATWPKTAYRLEYTAKPSIRSTKPTQRLPRGSVGQTQKTAVPAGTDFSN